MEIGITRRCLDIKVPRFSWNSQILDWMDIHKLPFTVSAQNFRTSYPKLTHSCLISTGKDRPSHMFPVTYSLPVDDMEQSPSLHSEDYSDDDAPNSKDSQAELLAQPLSSDELNTLLADSERVRLVRKLSEANQENRLLKRQLQDKEATLVNFKSELSVMELQVQALATLAEEISKGSIPDGSRKINGKYIQSHLHSRLEVLHEKLKEQLKDVEAARAKEVQLFWCGMAESVHVMGSFDGWSQGEYLSPEYDGSFTKFSTTLMLRPGRYEIKFLVDGEWKLSPEFPTVGEGLTENNLIVVE